MAKRVDSLSIDGIGRRALMIIKGAHAFGGSVCADVRAELKSALFLVGWQIGAQGVKRNRTAGKVKER